MSLRTLNQNARLHALKQQRKLDRDEWRSLVLQHTDYRTDTSAEMSEAEAAALVATLEGQIRVSMERMRTKAVATARRLGLVKRTPEGRETFAALNAWVLKYWKAASLFQLDYETLRQALTALENWEKQSGRKAARMYT